MQINRKYLFLLVNFIMLTGMILSGTDFFLAGTAAKVKYLFMLYCLIDILQYRKNSLSLNLGILFLILTMYVLLWRYVFVNPDMNTYISDHTSIMIYYLLLLIPSAQEVLHYRCIREYTITSCAALSLTLFIQVITHSNEWILNPVFAVRSFIGHNIIRSNFGFLHPNYVGNMCFLVISLLFIIYLEFSDNPLFYSRSKLLIVLLGCITFMVLLTTSSRTAFFSIVFFLLGAGILRRTGKVHFTPASKKILKKCLITGVLAFGVILVFSGAWDYIWTNSNRSLNVTQNVHWVTVLGNRWTGMGFVENAQFVSDPYNGGISAFGVKTSSLDMNYLFIYCTTGILGCCMMALILLVLGVSLYKNRAQEYGGYYLVLFFTLLFYAFWETVLFTYRFWAMLVPHVLLLYGACRKKERAEQVSNLVREELLYGKAVIYGR